MARSEAIEIIKAHLVAVHGLQVGVRASVDAEPRLAVG